MADLLRPNDEQLPPCMSPRFYSVYDPDAWRYGRRRISVTSLVAIGAAFFFALAMFAHPLVGIAAAIGHGLADTMRGL